MAVLTIDWSIPSINTQFPAGTRFNSTLYLENNFFFKLNLKKQPPKPRFVYPQPSDSQNPRVLFILQRVVLTQNPHVRPRMQRTTHHPAQHLEKGALIRGVHFRTVHHQKTVLIAMHHIVVHFTRGGARVNVLDLLFRVFQRRLDVFDAHVYETTEIAQKSIADQSQQGPYVQFHFVLRQFDTQFV